MISRKNIVEEARTWIGTPYRHQGRLRGAATDCIGLIGGVAMAFDLPGARQWALDRDLHNYARTPDSTKMLAACAAYFDRVPQASNAREGDVLLFSVEGYPRHFALLSSAVPGQPKYVIHAYALLAARKVVEQPLPIARTVLIAAYSFRGVEA